MGALVVATAERPHPSAPEASPVVPTRAINATHATGGTPDKSSTKSTNGVTAPTPPQAPATPQPIDTSAPAIATAPPTRTDAAPRQTEITKTITTEHKYRALTTPNDPMYSTFTSSNGARHTPFALQHLGAPTVWNTTTGSPVVIADIDTGFALNHEDLKNQWHQNTGEVGTATLSKDT